VTLHAALDLTLRLPDIRVDEAQSCDESSLVSSGKGWNVSRALRALGTPSHAIVAVAEEQSALFAQEADDTLRLILVDPGHMIRINVTLRLDSGVSHIRTRSSPVPPGFLASVEAAIRPVLAPGSTVAFSGSFPPGVEPVGAQIMWRRLLDSGHPVLVDSSGPGLAAAVATGVSLVKPNHLELQQLVNRRLESLEDFAAASGEICAMGVGTVLLSMGARGGMASSVAEGTWYVEAPREVDLVNDVGAGDAFLAGYIAAAGGGATSGDRLRHAVAAGSASLELAAPASLLADRAEGLCSALTAVRLS
jgi:1-phosphofructokinase